MNFNNLEKSNKESESAFKVEHLKNGVPPVMMAVYNRDEMTKDDLLFIDSFKKGSTTVKYGIDLEEANKGGFYNAGRGTYLISQIDNTNKYSEKYFDCTAVYATGLDKITGENISFLSHQNPEEFLKNKEVQISFKKDLSENLDELTSRSIPGSIDVVLLGGNKNISYADPIESVDMDKMNPQQAYDFIEQQDSGPMDKYRRSIKYIGKIIFDKLNFAPVVIAGPNSNIKENDFSHNNATDLYFDTKNRRIYQIREKNDSKNNESFSSSDVDKKIHDYK